MKAVTGAGRQKLRGWFNGASACCALAPHSRVGFKGPAGCARALSIFSCIPMAGVSLYALGALRGGCWLAVNELTAGAEAALPS